MRLARLTRHSSGHLEWQQQGCAAKLRLHARSLLRWWAFDLVIGVIIVGNAILIGADTSLRIGRKRIPASFLVLEYAMLGIFTAELGLRLFVYHCTALRSNWVKFDFFVICCGVLQAVADVLGSRLLPGSSVQLGILRILRLVRLARVVRLFHAVRTLWLLMSGLLHSMSTLLWTFIILLVVSYLFAVAGMELILGSVDVTSEAPYSIIARECFGDIGSSLLTLLQFFTLDSIAMIYRPLINYKPMFAFYFLSYILICSIALMNLVTAVMVETSMERSSKDRDMVRHAQKVQLERITGWFHKLDADSSGKLDLGELLMASDDLKDLMHEVFPVDHDIEDAFEMLDKDRDGSVDIDEFVHAILCVQAGKPLELVYIKRLCREMLDKFEALTAAHENFMSAGRHGGFRGDDRGKSSCDAEPCAETSEQCVPSVIRHLVQDL